MKRKSVVSVIFLLLLTGMVYLARDIGSSPGKSVVNQKEWWDEKLGDAWNVWLDECRDEKEKEMFLSAFAELEDSMIDGSYLDISTFQEENAELSFISYERMDTRYIHIEGYIEKWDRDGCEIFFPVEILIVADKSGTYEVYNDLSKRRLAGFLQDEDINFRLYGYSGREHGDIVDPLFIKYDDYTRIDDFWEKFKRVCIHIDEWQKEKGICLNQTARIGETAYIGDENLAMNYREMTLDFSKLAEDENEFARLKKMVQDERTALVKQMEEKEEKDTGQEVIISAYWHIFEPGDTLWKISETYYGSADKIQMICEDPHNQITNADLIYSGQWIYIPGE